VTGVKKSLLAYENTGINKLMMSSLWYGIKKPENIKNLPVCSARVYDYQPIEI